MFGLGLSEIIFIAILALVFIGPKQLPEVARTLGRFLNELKRTTADLTDEFKAHTRIDITGSAPQKPVVVKAEEKTPDNEPVQQEFVEQEPSQDVKYSNDDKKKNDA